MCKVVQSTDLRGLAQYCWANPASCPVQTPSQKATATRPRPSRSTATSLVEAMACELRDVFSDVAKQAEPWAFCRWQTYLTGNCSGRIPAKSCGLIRNLWFVLLVGTLCSRA